MWIYILIVGVRLILTQISACSEVFITVRLGKTRLSSGTSVIPVEEMVFGVFPTMSVPLNVIVADFGLTIPAIVLSVVLLPAPFAQIRVTI